jgi:hypothetical protein
MPVKPHLSPAELAAIAAAAKMAHVGVKVSWRNLGRRVDYVVDGKAHKVFTSQTDRVHVELCRQTREEFDAETKRLVEAQRAAKEAAKGASQAGAYWHSSERVAEREVPAVSAP